MSITAGERKWEMNVPIEGMGYQYEAEEANCCMRSGKVQSDVMPWEESLTVLRAMDKLRESWGLRYPME
jgi:hypothetical protein